jgi:hypothetical protein
MRTTVLSLFALAIITLSSGCDKEDTPDLTPARL